MQRERNDGIGSEQQLLGALSGRLAARDLGLVEVRFGDRACELLVRVMARVCPTRGTGVEMRCQMLADPLMLAQLRGRGTFLGVAHETLA